MTETVETPEAPAGPETFAELGIGKDVLEALDSMGWSTPTLVQAESYALASDGSDLIVQARTGTGKTGAFGIPIVDRIVDDTPGVQALVLAPTRELALQSAREIGKLAAHKGIRTTAVYGGAPIEKQTRELADGAQIVSGTPGRVLDHLRRRTLDPSGLKVLVLDEADEMLSMGFAKELNAIMELLPKKRQTLLFSATVDSPVQRMSKRHMVEPQFLELSGDAVGALGIDHFIYTVTGQNRAGDLVKILEVEDPESAIIFCNTKAETEQVAASLQAAGYNADWLNGDLAQRDREKIMARTRAEELRFLVATDVAARGIDVSHLTHVINFSLPEHIEQYIHRTGRTGRAGRTGTAIALVSPKELGTLYYLRLQYKIFPKERTLPSAGEERTRREMDRLGMLDAAITGTAEIDRAVAARLLTHPKAERLIAGLLGAFFGTTPDVDEVAAATRREKAPRPAPKRAKAAPKAEPKKPAKKAPVKAAAKPKAEDELEAKPAAARDERPSDDGDPDRQERPRRRSRRRRGEGRTDDNGASSDSKERDEERAERDDEDHVRLYVGTGRQAGTRVRDLNELFQEIGGLERKDVGRIRLRDKHSFVFVPAEKVDAVIEALNGHEFNGESLTVERAKA